MDIDPDKPWTSYPPEQVAAYLREAVEDGTARMRAGIDMQELANYIIGHGEPLPPKPGE